jgi:hypothetical protein
MDDVLIEFQDSLRNGMGLWEALKEYNLTLKEAMGRMDKPITKVKPRKVVFSTMGPYVYRRDNYYIVQKRMKSKTVNFGTYNNLDDAKKVRDYYLEHGWNRNTLNKVCRELGVERRKK